MRNRQRRAARTRLAAIAVVLAATACEPVYVFPGGALSGTEHPAPADWRFAPERVQLEMRPSDPYSVNIWGVGVGANFYIAAAAGATWTEAIADDANVRLRIDERIYLLAASRVDSEEELAEVIDAYVEKYGIDPAEDFVTASSVFRLSPR